MPAIAPALSPLLDEDTAASAPPAVAVAGAGVENGTVVVADPVEVTVVAALLVGRSGGATVAAGVNISPRTDELLASPSPLLAPHWPAYTQY